MIGSHRADHFSVKPDSSKSQDPAWLQPGQRRVSKPSVPKLSPDVLRRYETRDDIVEALREAIRHEAQLSAFGAHISSPTSGRLVDVSNEKVTLEVDVTNGVTIGLRSLCTIVFTHHQKQCVFFSVITTVGKPDELGFCTLTIRVPSRIDEVEARWNKRISIPSGVLVFAQIQFGECSELLARVSDIGRGGMDIELDSKASIPCGSRVKATIGTKELSASVEGEVRWKHGNRCGICFDYFHSRPVLGVSEEFEAILKTLEEWAKDQAA